MMAHDRNANLRLRVTRSLLLLLLTVFGGPAHSQPAQTPPMGMPLILNPPHVAFPYVIPSTLVPPPARQRPPGARAPASLARLEFSSQPQAAASQSVSCAAGANEPAPIAALASALKCDADLIFEYVYNNVNVEPLYGSNKGALGTLLDQRGSDADQAILLVTLWNAAGYSATGYANVTYSATGAEMSSWLGMANDAQAIETRLSYGGIPWCCETSNPDGTLASIDVSHFLAALQIGGTWYYFDPSFKYHSTATGISNLATVLGYSRSQFLSDAGGTVGSNSIANVNRGNLRNDLAAYASNLVSYINTNNPAFTVGSIVGGNTIEPLTGSPIRRQYSFLTPTASFPADCPNQTPANVPCRTVLSITMPGASSGQAIGLDMDQVYGHRITVSSVPSGNNFVPTLLIDGFPPSCVGQGPCTNVGPATPTGQVWSIYVQGTMPNEGYDLQCAPGISATFCKTLSPAAGGTYLVAASAGKVMRGMAEYHRQLLAQARAAGNGDTSEIVLGENLAVLAHTWQAESSAIMQIVDALAKTTTSYNFSAGITAQARIQQTEYYGPHVDLPVNIIDTVALSNAPTMTIGNYSYPISLVSAFMANSEVMSSLESAVLMQTQGVLPGMTAASTAMLVDANMNASYPGALGVTYFADGTNSAGQSYFTNNILPAIQSHYSSGDLANIESYVAAGYQIWIPENGTLQVGVWTGGGYPMLLPGSNDTLNMIQPITGGMLGGFSGLGIVDPSTQTVAANLPSPMSGVLQLLNSISTPFASLFSEPIDAVTGNYLNTHDDLVTGGGSFPYALAFSRTYTSASGTYLTTMSADAGDGNGWMNSYGATASTQSDPYVGIGFVDTPAIDAASSIAALYVMQDLLSVTPTAQTLTLSSMAAHWLTDQITGNAVLVVQPGTTEEYIALPHPDGNATVGYAAPPGSSARMTRIGSGQFTYQTKDGVVASFGPTPAGALQRWSYPNGMTVTVGYSGSKLSTVTNNLGRSLTVSYSGGDIERVTDDSGRMVTYGYDTNHNLTSFTDALGNITTYAYDTSGSYDLQGHLTQIYYPSNPMLPFVTNWYDGMGRAVRQANANGSLSSLYLAGSRSELVDGLGDRHVTYQTDRGKIIKDAWVLSSTFGDVFNDTPQQNGVVNVTANQYDGLDRITLTTLPEGGTASYTYVTALNPWANNVGSVTRTGWALPPVTTAYTYDPIYNKVTSITDPLGLVGTASYDPATGNLLSTVADAGAAPHFNAANRFTYDSYGRALTATDPLGVVTKFSYDSFENLVSQVADSGPGHIDATTLYGYDSVGNMTSRTDPNGNTTRMTYDTARRLVSSVSPLGITATNSYDADGRILSVTRGIPEQSVVTRYGYTATGKVRTVTDPNGNVTMNAYDADDRLASATDPMGRVTIYGYDAMSREISVSNPAFGAPLLQQSYTPDGLRASLTDANGNTTNFAYDGLDRLASANFPDSSAESYTYDADGNRLTRQTRRGDTISFTYDTLNRLHTKTAAATPAACNAAPSTTPTVTYAYDLLGRRTGVCDNSTAIVSVAGTSASYAASYSYDAANRPTGVAWPNVPAQTAPAASTAGFTYTYNRDNQRSGATATDNSWWSYPPAAAGTTGYTANALNQYTAVGPVTPAYDGDGNLAYDGTFTYGYDVESRLISAAGGGLTASYAYDAQGRRKAKTVNGTTTVFVTDADNREVLDYDGTTGQIQRWYAYGPGPDEVLNQVNVAAGTRETMIPDVQGSIAGTLDSGSGAITKTGYQPFGENPSLVSASPTFAYTARRLDPETGTASGTTEPDGLSYLRSRMYSPGFGGRFLQPDSIGYAGGANLYAYVGNDPLNNTDPSGMCVPCVGAASSVLLGAGIRYATGANPLDLTAIAADAALGAVGAGLASKFYTAAQLLEAGAPGTIGYARYVGALGEEAIGATGARQGISVGGTTLFPDVVGTTNLTEAKNVATISASDAAQIAGYEAFSTATGLGPVQVFTREVTDVSAIQNFLAKGTVEQQFLPGVNNLGVYSLTTGGAAGAGALFGGAYDVGVAVSK